MKLFDELRSLQSHVKKRIEEMTGEQEVLSYESEVFGRKGAAQELFKRIAECSAKEKPAIGKLINEIKKDLTKDFAAKKSALCRPQVGASTFDVTLQGEKLLQGHVHLVTHAIDRIEEIFIPLGFSRMSYPEIEWDYYAFEALNMPVHHPARDEWETFFINEQGDGRLGRIVLTPHTSSAQVREMEKRSTRGEGVRMINIAKCYRRQSDISHVPMFHQFEGLAVDRTITMRDLIGTIEYFVKNFFGNNRTFRLRPYHFRFTEPSFEIDVTCGICAGKGCAYCKDGWSEIAGAGMVHPSVLKAGGYDPKKYTGFAFGFGVERSYMMKNNLNLGDLRLLYSNDIRYLEQF